LEEIGEGEAIGVFLVREEFFREKEKRKCEKMLEFE
jgi:hypothetical protein